MFELGEIIKVKEFEVYGGRLGKVVDNTSTTSGYYVLLIGEEEEMFFEEQELERAKPMEFFEAIIKDGLEKELPFMYVEVKMDGFVDNEIIINPLVNFESKLDYYKYTYDEDMNHKFSSGIRIVGFGVAESMQIIEEVIYEEESIDDYDLGLTNEPKEEKSKYLTSDEFKELPVGTKVYVEYDKDYWTIPVKDGVEEVVINDWDEKDIEDKNGELLGSVCDSIDCGCVKIYVVEKVQTFKDGEYVLINCEEGYDRYNGKIGVIESYDGNSKWEYVVRVLGEKNNLAFGESELLKFEGFEEGDKVFVVGFVDNTGEDDYVGEEGFIKHLDEGDDYPYEVVFENDRWLSFKDGELQFV